MDVPEQFIKKVRCYKCHFPLSVLPVHTDDEGLHTCGRCPLMHREKQYRDSAFEMLAGMLLFPCTYRDEGCIETLKPVEMAAHEKICHYRTWPCYESDCEWKGPAFVYLQHYADEHPHSILQEVTDVPVNLLWEEFRENYVIDVFSLPFIVQIYKDKNNLYLTVNLVGLERFACLYNYCFHLHSKEMPEGTDVPISKVQWNISGTDLNLEKASLVKLGGVWANTEVIQVQVSITKDKKFLPVAVPKNIDVLNEKLLKHIECHTCLISMVPPIFQCSEGHILCEDCNKKFTNCPTCKVVLTNIRNRPLEDITSDIIYECIYDGCNATFKAAERKQHLEICSFAPYSCPWNACQFNGEFEQLLTHISNTHSEAVMDYNEQKIYPDDLQEEMFFLRHNSCLYQVCQKQMENCFYLSVVFIGPRELPNNFYYIVDTKRTSDRAERIYAKFKCFDSNVPPYSDGCLVLSMDLVKTFVDDIHVTYSISIVQE